MGGPIIVSMYDDFAKDQWVITVRSQGYPKQTFYYSHQWMEAGNSYVDTAAKLAVEIYVERFSLDVLDYAGYTIETPPITPQVGLNFKESPWEKMKSFLADKFPVLNRVEKCPECKQKEYVRGQIIHLNDKHKWTREQIATWIDGLEGNK